MRGLVALAVLAMATGVMLGENSTLAQEQTGAASGPFDGFRGHVEELMQKWEVPGMAVCVVRDGKVIYMEGFGHRDVEKCLAVTPETLFAIGSVSKPFTALSVGMLVDERKLDWDTPVIEYLPDFRLSQLHPLM